MARSDTRQRILDNGALLVHARGFVNTGIKDILDASGVPKGSFYFYFKSKEDFGRALIDHFSAFISSFFGRYLDDRSAPPLERLRRFFKASRTLYEKGRFSGGCPIGNLSQEMSDLSEPMRKKLNAAFSQMRSALRDCLIEAQRLGQVDERLDAGELAVFILNAWEGALIDMKVSRSKTPLVIFEKMIFGLFEGGHR